MEKWKYQVLLGSDLVLENPHLYSPDSSDEMSELSEFSETSSPFELTESSSGEEQVDSICFSRCHSMARRKRMLEIHPTQSLSPQCPQSWKL